MNPSILAISTALPSHTIQQAEIVESMIELFQLGPSSSANLRKLYHNSGINTRYSVIPDFNSKVSKSQFYNENGSLFSPTFSERNALYKLEAPKLAAAAAEKALKEWGQPREKITHIISVSCTGIVAPGIEFSLMQSLSLRPDIYRLGINFMGCFGAFKGLEVANAYASLNPENRILVICTELCSLHMQERCEADAHIANALFADGAAAVIVGCEPQNSEQPLWEIVHQRSMGLEGSLNEMTWEAGDKGFIMRLSQAVPSHIKQSISSFSELLLDNHFSVENCDWAIHPGGKAILKSVEEALSLESWQTESSWKVLGAYGNMSSPTFLFVLDEIRRRPDRKKGCAGLGFGPGLSFEGIILASN